MTLRWTRFLTVGLGGFLVQAGALAVLTMWLRWAWLPATVIAVELAVVHNFVWHERWTWRDLRGGWAARFARFQLANGLLSLGATRR